MRWRRRLFFFIGDYTNWKSKLQQRYELYGLIEIVQKYLSSFSFSSDNACASGIGRAYWFALIVVCHLYWDAISANHCVVIESLRIGDQNMTIGNNSCNNCLACSKNMGTLLIRSLFFTICLLLILTIELFYPLGTTTILDGSCSDLYACSYTRGYTSIGASSCSGGYSCMNVTDTSIFNDSCHGVRSCSNLYNSAIGYVS